MPIERSDIGIMDFTEDEKEEVRYCKRCLEFNVYSPLKNRLYDNNQVEIDHENWLQCHYCGSIYAINEVQREAEIKDVIEKIDNASEISKNQFLGVNPRRKKNRLEQLEEEYEDIKERELKNALRKGHTLLSYNEEMPTT
ncbi:MAG TPA: hypothetical protein VJ772_01860 [Nitrososphaeraceae archaeon]|nr:hypothetical protein [Nitrososphaeraceae archaeon]